MHHRYFWVMQYRKKQIQRINILQNLLFFLYCFSVIFEFSVSCRPFSKSWKRTFFVPAHEITKNAICMFHLFHKTQFLWNKRSSGIFIPERLSQIRYFQKYKKYTIILLSSRLYCRLRNCTESCLAARGLYHRWRISLRPEDFMLFTSDIIAHFYREVKLFYSFCTRKCTYSHIASHILSDVWCKIGVIFETQISLM